MICTNILTVNDNGKINFNGQGATAENAIALLIYKNLTMLLNMPILEKDGGSYECHGTKRRHRKAGQMRAVKRATFITVCIAVGYLAVEAVLSFTDYSFRTWVKMLGQMITAVIMPIMLLVLALTFLYKSERVHQVVKTLCITAAVFVCGLYCFFAMFFIVLGKQEEQMLTRNLLVTNEAFLGEDDFVYYRPVAFFFKTPAQITAEEIDKYTDKRHETEREEHVRKPSENAWKDEDKAEEKLPETEQEMEPEMEQEPEADYRETAARAVYDALLSEEGFSYEVYYNAKGNLYIELGTKTSEEDGKTYSYSLVYDRPSKNGACELLVLYRTAEGSESEAIVDMYAVETATGKVAASGRKAWSDVGTEEYREMTGE